MGNKFDMMEGGYMYRKKKIFNRDTVILIIFEKMNKYGNKLLKISIIKIYNIKNKFIIKQTKL